jgi:hypothetical protein
MVRFRDRGALVLAYLEDLAKVTAMRVLVFVAHGCFAWLTPVSWLAWYESLLNLAFDPILFAARRAGVVRSDMFWLWITMPFYLTWLYRILADRADGGPRSLRRRGFARKPTSLLLSIARNAPGALLAYPPCREATVGLVGAPRRGPLLVVAGVAWSLDVLLAVLPKY